MTPVTIDTVRTLLSFIPPDVARAVWAQIAMALKSEFGEAGFDLFDTFSARGEKYKATDTRSTWRSVKAGGGVTIASLFHLAKEHGWRPDDAQTSAPAQTPAERAAEVAARREAAQRERDAQAARQRVAAEKARRLCDAASEAGESAYLRRKGVRGYGVRYARGGVLLVPMRDAAGELWNVQACYPAPLKDRKTGEPGPDKLYRAGEGSRKSGLWHLIGAVQTSAPDAANEGPPLVILVCEGYATGASLHEATGRAVAIAFDAGNLVHVAGELRRLHPAALIVLCADNDLATKGNPGREAASKAAEQVRGVLTWPEGLPEGKNDFNDLHAHAGLDAVRQKVEAAIAEALQSAPNAAAKPRLVWSQDAPEDGAKAPAADRPGKPAKSAPSERKARGKGNGASGPREPSDGPRDRFRVDADGLWFDPPGEDVKPVRVCDPLRVTGLARDAQGNGASLVLEFDTPYCKAREWLLPRAMLATDGATYRSELFGQGFAPIADSKRRGLLSDYLCSRKPSELVLLTDRVGWHGTAYVLPRETLGDTNGEPLKFHQPGIPLEVNFQQRGTSAQWREKVARVCVGNTRLTLAVCCALAGPLLRWAEGTDAAGVHVWGNSSLGKSTGHAIAASVWGIGGDSKTPGTYIQEWKASDNGLEGLAAQHSDAALILDEFGRLDPKIAGEAAYQLSNGKGKQRAGQSGAARPRLTWRTMFYSAGETGLRDHMATAGQTPKAGQEIRFLEVPAEVAPETMYETVHEFKDGDALAIAMKAATVRVYGTVGREWLEWLVANAAQLSPMVREAMNRFEGEHVRDGFSGQAKRAARCFALRAAAGEMATAQGLTGWPEGWAAEAIGKCWDAWVAGRVGGVGVSEDVQRMRQMRLWFATFGEMNFKPWGRTDTDKAPATPMMCGWRRPTMGDEKNEAGALVSVETGRTWYVIADAFKATVCKGQDYRACLRLLKARGLLELSPSDIEASTTPKAFRAKPPGESASGADVYRVKSAILATGDD
jgi:putative DNA primase/helicase